MKQNVFDKNSINGLSIPPRTSISVKRQKPKEQRQQCRSKIPGFLKTWFLKSNYVNF